MKPGRDSSQYGNEKGLSINHYLIKLIHKTLTILDTNSKGNTAAVIAQMIDWSQAFDRQCPQQGVQSFIENGVRPSLIPIVADYFKNRKMVVKLNGAESSQRSLKGLSLIHI